MNTLEKNMHIVLGASGQVGSGVVDWLIRQKQPVKGVIRNPEKATELQEKGAKTAIADAFDQAALQTALKDGTTIFVLTPETLITDDIIGDTKTILENYRKAVESSSIKKIVGLSSYGAQHASGTGNLMLSYMLEHAFVGLPVQQIFVRPAYYYSNFLPYLPVVKAEGILPTFFPVDLKLPMISPQDVAHFVAEAMTKTVEGVAIYELEGPTHYSPEDVAQTLGQVLNKDVKAEQIPRQRWKETLQQAGFYVDAMKNLMEMTEAVISGLARPEKKETIAVTGRTTLEQYMIDLA
ncbi:NmrA family NAD(P)-binding protein [Catalinimonas niigatensis]|uniref:NmrA family NAD(P)-binding protein n=1 Tax=Catalinimonas niigatensis TaxID=1397264 RepID=UPI002666261C|nr:NAD(P)H-binding protein [Catalinimonas niigatensis]WPP48564.1 NAD(P)H-binding protein [Catalinimonas niigatensis]